MIEMFEAIPHVKAPAIGMVDVVFAGRVETVRLDLTVD
jgi:hypothetical protein